MTYCWHDLLTPNQVIYIMSSLLNEKQSHNTKCKKLGPYNTDKHKLSNNFSGFDLNKFFAQNLASWNLFPKVIGGVSFNTK